MDDLLNKPIFQMNGNEFLQLISLMYRSDRNLEENHGVVCRGVKELADYLGCCEATVYSLKKQGVLDSAVISKIGKRFVFDGVRARKAANEFLNK